MTKLKPRVHLKYVCGVMYAIIQRGEMQMMRPLYWSKS